MFEQSDVDNCKASVLSTGKVITMAVMICRRQRECLGACEIQPRCVSSTPALWTSLQNVQACWSASAWLRPRNASMRNSSLTARMPRPWPSEWSVAPCLCSGECHFPIRCQEDRLWGSRTRLHMVHSIPASGIWHRGGGARGRRSAWPWLGGSGRLKPSKCIYEKSVADHTHAKILAQRVLYCFISGTPERAPERMGGGGGGGWIMDLVQKNACLHMLLHTLVCPS